MSNAKDTITNAQTETGESLKDVAQNNVSSIEKDALSDSALEEVQGTGWPYTTSKNGTVTPTI